MSYPVILVRTMPPPSKQLTSLLLTALLALLPAAAWGQDTRPLAEPVRPTPPSTLARSPRGTDIVEPVQVYKVSHYASGRVDTTYLGVAKIPDPRRREVGAILRRDVDSGILIRFDHAWIIDEGGLRRIVELDLAARSEELIFRPGRHDEVTSRQGVAADQNIPGHVTSFDLSRLYDAANVNPLSGRRLEAPQPRMALLTMQSTYPGGEAVHLAVPLTRATRTETFTSFTIERRDTTFTLRPQVTVRMPPPPVERRRRLSVLARLESGYGSSLLRTGIPSNTIPPFTTSGYADAYYVDGSLLLDRIDHRWRVDLYGTSSVSNTGITEVNDHMVALQAKLRFEYGGRDYVALQASGLMADKQYQEFDWDSADYAGMLLVGYGQRTVNKLGLESQRTELLVGLRMGEHREIEVFESRQRARGIGPMLALDYNVLHMRPSGMELYLAARGSTYGLIGRGDRDEEFRELGIRLEGEVTVGKEMTGMFVYATLNNIWRTDHAWLPDDYHYYAYRLLLIPGVGVQMRL